RRCVLDVRIPGEPCGQQAAGCPRGGRVHRSVSDGCQKYDVGRTGVELLLQQPGGSLGLRPVVVDAADREVLLSTGTGHTGDDDEENSNGNDEAGTPRCCSTETPQHGTPRRQLVLLWHGSSGRGGGRGGTAGGYPGATGRRAALRGVLAARPP